MVDEFNSMYGPGPGFLPAPEPGSIIWTNPTQVALNYLVDLRRHQAETQADLADPVRQEWLKESAAGQDIKIKREMLRIADILCWNREDPALLLSVGELVEDLGRQLAQIATLALYLEALGGTTLAELSASYETACGIKSKETR